VHVDVDVLDPAVMPAVDAPDPGGIAFPELELLLSGLVDTPHCLGVEITVFDPDYDPDGAYAEEITSTLVAGLAPVRAVAARPDLVAARRDLAGRGDSAALRDPAGSQDPVRERRAVAAQESVVLAADAVSPNGALPAANDEIEPAGEAAFLDISESDMSIHGEPADQRRDADLDHQSEHFDDADSEPSDEDESALVGDEDSERSGDDQFESTNVSDSPPAPTPEAVIPAQPLTRPLGSAPRLDSEPLPATRPGMLRPRAPEPANDGFSLPVQRPAFDVGSGEPADIA
jgi:arginase